MDGLQRTCTGPIEPRKHSWSLAETLQATLDERNKEVSRLQAQVTAIRQQLIQETNNCAGAVAYLANLLDIAKQARCIRDGEDLTEMVVRLAYEAGYVPRETVALLVGERNSA